MPWLLKKLTTENQTLKNQVDTLQKFIAYKWFIDIEKVQEYVEDYMSKGEFESVKVIQGRLELHDWILNELDRFEKSMQSMVVEFNYGRNPEEERKAEGVVK